MEKSLIKKWLNSSAIHWYYAAFASFLYILYAGYFFNYGDQEEHLSQVYKMFDPSLYPHDYFMLPNAETYSVRFYYKWLVYGFSVLTGVETACFVLTMTTIIVSAWSVSKMTAYFGGSGISAFLAPLLLLLLFNNTCIGDNSFQDNELIGSSLSVMFCSLAFLYFFKGNYLAMAAFTGLAGWFQILAALLVAALLCALLFINKKTSFFASIRYFLVFILVSSPMLFPILYRQFFTHSNFDMDAYYIALYHIRNPNHYLPSFFPAMEYIRFAIFMAMALLLMWIFRMKERKFVISITVLVVAGMMIYYLLLEKAGLLAIGKTQFFKTTIWLTMFYAMLIAIACERILAGFVDNTKLLVFFLRSSFPVLLLALIVIFNSAAMPLRFFRERYRIGNYPKSDLQKMHEWIASQTDKNAVFLVNPANFSFLCDAKRSLLIGHKSVIHEPYFMVPWALNFQRIYKFSYDTLQNMTPLQAAKEGFNNYPYHPLAGEKLDYRLDNVNECKFVTQLGKVVHKEGDYILTEVIH